MTDQEGAQGAQDEGEQQFALQKIYLKDLSFETPNSPEIFMEKWEPVINVELQTSGKPLDEAVHEVVLTITVTAKLGEKTAYLVETQQAGVFTVAGFGEAEQGYMLGSYCPNILFPFAREVIADLVAKGGFPQMLLGPVNFDAMYSERLQQQAAAAAGEEPVH